jgi:hypothetical protein
MFSRDSDHWLPRRALRRESKKPSRALLVGYFSFDAKTATAGDVLACEVAARWLQRANLPYDIAMAEKYGGNLDWRNADPDLYSHVIWVAGPVYTTRKQEALRQRFQRSRLIALDVTMLDELAAWNPYDAVVERDSVRVARPDISFLAADRRAPVTGLCLIRQQTEYGARARHEVVVEACQRLIRSRPMAVVEIDTVLKPVSPGRRDAAEVQALIARMDVVVTNRLHGMVLSIKQGVPVVAIDSVQGGGKVSRQAEAIGWPVLNVDSLADADLSQAFEFALTDRAREMVAAARRRATSAAEAVEEDFRAALGMSAETGSGDDPA